MRELAHAVTEGPASGSGWTQGQREGTQVWGAREGTWPWGQTGLEPRGPHRPLPAPQVVEINSSQSRA